MTDKPDVTKIMLLRESVLESWASDASTFALFTALVGIGWLLGSEPLQWVGALIGFFTISRAAHRFGQKKIFTIAEARAELDRLEKAS
jgi:hypothetical protein